MRPTKGDTPELLLLKQTVEGIAMAVVGYQLRATFCDSEASETIVLQFEDEVRIIKRQTARLERHWLEQHLLRISNRRV
jgi:hypothetical protein